MHFLSSMEQQLTIKQQVNNFFPPWIAFWKTFALGQMSKSKLEQ